MHPHRYIVIEGNIGAGKTSLARLLAQHYNAELVLEEFAENTFLPLFYKDPERFAFPLEMSFMAERYRQLKKVFEQMILNKPVISDYLFDKSLLFARVNLKEDELKLFENFFLLVKDSIPQPDLLVYLKKEAEHLKKNIAKRGRNFESGIKTEYLTSINNSYNSYLESNPSLKKITISEPELDFILNKKDFEYIVNKISNSGTAGIISNL